MSPSEMLLAVPRFAVGVLLRSSGRVSVAPGCKVNWLRLRASGGGSISLGKDSIIDCRIDFDSPHGNVTIGERSYLGACHLVCHTGISVGHDVIVSWGVTVVDHDSHSVYWDERKQDVADWRSGGKNWKTVKIAPVRIADRVWIGFGASVLKGVCIGEGAVVAASSVVTRDVEPYTLVAGNPAQLVRRLERK